VAEEKTKKKGEKGMEFRKRRKYSKLKQAEEGHGLHQKGEQCAEKGTKTDRMS